jgi:hypothetical protein
MPTTFISQTTQNKSNHYNIIKYINSINLFVSPSKSSKTMARKFSHINRRLISSLTSSKMNENKLISSILYAVLAVVVVEGFLTTTSSLFHHERTCTGGHYHRLGSLFNNKNNNCLLLSSSAVDESSSSKWLDKGLLLSSFTDGLKSNPQVQGWLFEALVERLWKEERQRTQKALEQSNKFSPCNGPDPIMWERLEEIDQVVDELYPSSSSSAAAADAQSVPSSFTWKQSLDVLLSNKRNHDQENDAILELRILYIPTAMYALRSDSTNTPGKQRQRARVDGKKRRNEIVHMLATNLKGLSVLAVTLDFDDGSVKQPECTCISDDDSRSSIGIGPQFPAVSRRM